MDKLCSKIDTCPKIAMLRDKDMLDEQFVESVRAVCGKCSEFTTESEQDELLLTKEEMMKIGLETPVDRGLFWMDVGEKIAKAQLAKAKQHYEPRMVEAIRLLEKVVPEDKGKMIEWAVKSQDSVYTNAGAAYRILKGD